MSTLYRAQADTADPEFESETTRSSLRISRNALAETR